MNGYTDTMVFLTVAQKAPTAMIEKGSRYAGVANQLGALIGSLISFAVVQLDAI